MDLYRSTCIVLLLFALAVGASSGTYYVSPDGNNENSGTIDSPWLTVEHALSKTGGGQLIVLKPGVYHSFVISKAYAGTQVAPTIIRSEIKWKASIIGSSTHGIYTSDGCDWVIIDGFEVMGARIDGIKVSGDFSTVRNCWVHSNAQMGIAMHGRRNGVIENNLVEFNGTNVQFHHGVYADGDGLIIRSNIVRHNAGFGLHLYPSLSHSSITNNLIYGHSFKPGVTIYCPVGGGQNIIANNTIADNRDGLGLTNGKGEVVANNIFSGNDIHTYSTNTIDTSAQNNLLFSPINPQFGTETVYANPLFVAAQKGAYWLKAGSPAIGSGNAKYFPATNFWGSAYTGSPYIGAFPYDTQLDDVTDTWYASWYYGWGYGYPPSPRPLVPDAAKYEVPDFWEFIPTNANNVSVAISVPSMVVSSGQVITITVSYSNSGSVYVKDAIIKAQVPDTMTYVSGSAEASGGKWDAVTNTVSWTVGSLAANESGVKVYKAAVK